MGDERKGRMKKCERLANDLRHHRGVETIEWYEKLHKKVNITLAEWPTVWKAIIEFSKYADKKLK